MKENNEKKPLTLEDLADYSQKVLLPAINQRFEKVDQCFDENDRRFDKILHRFDKVDEQFVEVKKEIGEKFDRVLEGEDRLMKRIVDNEIEQGAHTVQHDRQRDQLDEHEKRIGQLESKVSAG